MRCQHKILSSGGEWTVSVQSHWLTPIGRFGYHRPRSSWAGTSRPLPLFLLAGTPQFLVVDRRQGSTLSQAQQRQLTGPFLQDEVRAAIRGLNAEGALGPDGIPIFFYKDCWARVGPEVMALMEELHACTCRMDRINRAYITVLPKTPGAERVGDFCPISLSNNIYLIIAKVLSNRLRELLGTLISPLQSAFIPGRQMVDSVVVAEEIIAAWRRSGTSGFVWKVDFAKAYDSLDWRFLWNVLKRRGFPEA